MSPTSFVDTNVLVYSIDVDEPAKRRTARDLLADVAPFALSGQVLSELFHVVTRKITRPLPPDATLEAMESLWTLPVIAIDGALVRAAIELSVDAQLSLWDAQIVVAARLAGCERVLTEDLQDGAVLGGVRIENPFR